MNIFIILAVCSCVEAIKEVFLWHILFIVKIHIVIAEDLLSIDNPALAVCQRIDKAVVGIRIYREQLISFFLLHVVVAGVFGGFIGLQPFYLCFIL